MTSKTFVRKPEFAAQSQRITTLLQQLRKKLQNFVVKDRKGEVLGSVEDVILDPERQVSLVIASSKLSQADQPLVVNSHHIERIAPEERLLYLDIDHPLEVESTIAAPPLPVASTDASQLIFDSDDPDADTFLASNASPTSEIPMRRPVETLPPSEIRDASSAPKATDYDRPIALPDAFEQPTQTLINQTVMSSTAPDLAASTMADPDPTPINADDIQPAPIIVDSAPSLTTDHAKVVEEEIIPLGEERLIVERHRQKLGEVVVRKVIETQMVQVPVRREKLVIEQVGGTTTNPLAEIDLGADELAELPMATTVAGTFPSLKAASMVLDAIAHQDHHACHSVQVEIVLNDPSQQALFQRWFDECCGK